MIELGDIDELVRHVDRLCAAGAWDEIVDLRDRARKALERGRQLWPVASRAEYRLALDAPAPWAASVLVAGTGRFALGPLPEVAASTHTWEELAPHVARGVPEPTVTAHERVVRGEDLQADGRIDESIIELPLRLHEWEPDYPFAIYTADEAQFPLQPVLRGWEEWSLKAQADLIDDDEATQALVEIATAWTRDSNGAARAIAVEGDALAAVTALDVTDFRIAPLVPSDAIARLAWAAASGGAHGRRRGMAAGRFAAWWASAAITGLLEDWPVEPDELGDAINDLTWYVWEPLTETSATNEGWSCRIAVEDPTDNIAWALTATDHT